MLIDYFDFTPDIVYKDLKLRWAMIEKKFEFILYNKNYYFGFDLAPIFLPSS